VDTHDSHLQKKIAQYSGYRPEEAARDAGSDVRAGTVRIFFLALEEVAQPIGIEADWQVLGPHATVFVGDGCIDPSDSPDCPGEYREALENAAAYGRIYNQEVLRLLKNERGQEPKAADVENETAAFLGPPKEWHKIRIELRDIQPLFGGREIFVDGSGETVVRRVRTQKDGLREKKYRWTLDSKDLSRLIRAFITHDFMTIRIGSFTVPPDTAIPVIILINPKGDSRSVSGPDPQVQVPGQGAETPMGRFHELYRELLRIEAMADRR